MYHLLWLKRAGAVWRQGSGVKVLWVVLSPGLSQGGIPKFILIVHHFKNNTSSNAYHLLWLKRALQQCEGFVG